MEKRLPGLTGKGPFSAFLFFFVKGAAAGGGICDCGSAGKGADTVDLIPAVARTANQAQALPFSCFLGRRGKARSGNVQENRKGLRKGERGGGKPRAAGHFGRQSPSAADAGKKFDMPPFLSSNRFGKSVGRAADGGGYGKYLSIGSKLCERASLGQELPGKKEAALQAGPFAG